MSKQALPRHMAPAAVFVERTLPRLPGTKIDRLKLADLDRQRTAASNDRLAGSLIDRIACVFEEEIGVSGATADDNVWSLGGDSLQAVRIVAELERLFDIGIPEGDFERIESIRDLARWIEGKHARLRA
jgi:acyl carrier protein